MAKEDRLVSRPVEVAPGRKTEDLLVLRPMFFVLERGAVVCEFLSSFSSFSESFGDSAAATTIGAATIGATIGAIGAATEFLI